MNFSRAGGWVLYGMLIALLAMADGQQGKEGLVSGLAPTISIPVGTNSASTAPQDVADIGQRISNTVDDTLDLLPGGDIVRGVIDEGRTLKLGLTTTMVPSSMSLAPPIASSMPPSTSVASVPITPPLAIATPGPTSTAATSAGPATTTPAPPTSSGIGPLAPTSGPPSTASTAAPASTTIPLATATPTPTPTSTATMSGPATSTPVPPTSSLLPSLAPTSGLPAMSNTPKPATSAPPTSSQAPPTSLATGMPSSTVAPTTATPGPSSMQNATCTIQAYQNGSCSSIYSAIISDPCAARPSGDLVNSYTEAAPFYTTVVDNNTMVAVYAPTTILACNTSSDCGLGQVCTSLNATQFCAVVATSSNCGQVFNAPLPPSTQAPTSSPTGAPATRTPAPSTPAPSTSGAPPPPTTLPPVTLPNTTFYCGSGLNFSATAAADNFTYSSNVTVSGRVVQLAYDMYSNPDRLRVYDGRGALVYDSGYVGLDFACAVSAQVQAALVDSGNGCQGLTGPSRVSQTVPFCCEEFSPCPTPASINIARGTDAPEVFTFTVDSPCANSAWALEFGCPVTPAPVGMGCGQELAFSTSQAAANSIYFGALSAPGITALQIAYDMYSAPDRLQLFDSNATLVFDSGDVGIAYTSGCNGPEPTLKSAGNGCQGLTGPLRVARGSQGTYPCPTPSPAVVLASPDTYTFAVTSPCSGQASWALSFACLQGNVTLPPASTYPPATTAAPTTTPMSSSTPPPPTLPPGASLLQFNVLIGNYTIATFSATEQTAYAASIKSSVSGVYNVSISGVTTDGGGNLVIATSVILDTSSLQDLAVALANTALPEAVYGSTLVTSGGSPVNLGDVIYSALLAYVPEGNTNGTSFNSTGLSHTTSLLQRTGNRELSFENALPAQDVQTCKNVCQKGIVTTPTGDAVPNIKTANGDLCLPFQVSSDNFVQDPHYSTVTFAPKWICENCCNPDAIEGPTRSGPYCGLYYDDCNTCGPGNGFGNDAVHALQIAVGPLYSAELYLQTGIPVPIYERFDSVFAPACDAHDLCFETPGQSYDGCNSAIIDNMKQACSAAFPAIPTNSLLGIFQNDYNTQRLMACQQAADLTLHGIEFFNSPSYPPNSKSGTNPYLEAQHSAASYYQQCSASPTDQNGQPTGCAPPCNIDCECSSLSFDDYDECIDFAGDNNPYNARYFDECCGCTTGFGFFFCATLGPTTTALNCANTCVPGFG